MSRLPDVHMLYIDKQGEAVPLDDEGQSQKLTIKLL